MPARFTSLVMASALFCLAAHGGGPEIDDVVLAVTGPGELTVSGVHEDAGGAQRSILVTDPAGDAVLPGRAADIVEVALSKQGPVLRVKLGTTPGAAESVETLRSWSVHLLSDLGSCYSVVAIAEPGSEVRFLGHSGNCGPFMPLQIDGQINGSGVIWHVPISKPPFRPGDSIRLSPDLGARTGLGAYVAGSTAEGNQMDEAKPTDEAAYVMPGGVRVDLFDEDWSRVAARTARPGADGSFAVVFSSLESGEYGVELRAGNGDLTHTMTQFVTVP